jgi:phenylpyruvate tautomerase PptA (4-oxalocrotonate tautomerase family)
MTIITVTAPEQRLSVAQRRQLAKTLTDAVLEPEVGQPSPAARAGFQVHFRELPADCMAIGGELLSDQTSPRDIMTVNIAVMDAAWPAEVRERVIRGVLARLAEACDMPKPSPHWWVTFQIIDEGSWDRAAAWCRSCSCSTAALSRPSGSKRSAMPLPHRCPTSAFSSEVVTCFA